MKRLVLVLAAVALGIVPGAALASTAAASSISVNQLPAGVDDFGYESLTVDYFLSRNSEQHATLTTVETFVAIFPDSDQNRGIIRAIPNDYDGVPLRTSVQSVVDENGVAVPFDAEVYNGFTELALGTDDFVHGRTTYVITYTQENVVRAFSDTNSDEFYWDVNGTGFSQPFGTVTAHVHVDESLTAFLTGNASCYQGAWGATDGCDNLTLPGNVDDTFTAKAYALMPGETLTIAIGFDYGTFVQVPATIEANNDDAPGDFGWPVAHPPWWVDAGGIAIAVLTVLGAAFTVVWRFVTPKSAKGSGIIIPQYTVPKGINVLEAANIAGQSWFGLSAQIVSFAVRGKLRILDYPVTNSGAQYTLQLLDTNDLDDQELALMTALFGTGLDAQVFGALRSINLFDEQTLRRIQEQSSKLEIGAVREVGVIDDQASRAVSAVQAGVGPRILARGFKQKRSSLVGLFTAAALFLLFFASMALVISAGVFYGTFSGWGFFSAFATIFFSIVCIVFAWRPPALTASGAQWHDYLLGMRDYLKLAEAERFKMLQSPEGAERVRVEGIDIRRPAEKVKLYEKLLPFAVMWGIEKEWASELALYYGSAAPEWFVSSRGFDPGSFSVALSTISRSTLVRRTTSSSSSGRSSWSGSSGGSFSGGSRGGGFSGGGGGGGGGGGR